MSDWLDFIEIPNEGKKTKRWGVVTKEKELIGVIKWYGAWRKYCFFPGAETVYEEDCLRSISEKIEYETKEYKVTWTK